MQKSTTVQLARDKDSSDSYILYKKGAKPKLDSSGVWQPGPEGANYIVILCPSMFEPFLPSSLHLPPGGGPVDITITIKDSK